MSGNLPHVFLKKEEVSGSYLLSWRRTVSCLPCPDMSLGTLFPAEVRCCTHFGSEASCTLPRHSSPGTNTLRATTLNFCSSSWVSPHPQFPLQFVSRYSLSRSCLQRPGSEGQRQGQLQTPTLEDKLVVFQPIMVYKEKAK